MTMLGSHTMGYVGTVTKNVGGLIQLLLLFEGRETFYWKIFLCFLRVLISSSFWLNSMSKFYMGV